MEFNDTLMQTMDSAETQTAGSAEFFINFLNKLEGWKTKCKNLHWAAPKDDIHTRLDEFLDILNLVQDAIAEDYMGILGQMQPNVIKGIPVDSLNALDFIENVRRDTVHFSKCIPDSPVYDGIKGECDAFIHNINKYKYLFSLCDVTPY